MAFTVAAGPSRSGYLTHSGTKRRYFAGTATPSSVGTPCASSKRLLYLSLGDQTAALDCRPSPWNSSERFAALQCRDLIETMLMSATLERGTEPGIGDRDGFLRRYHLGPQYEHIRAVVRA
jgi:hypothetical protein